MCDRDYGRGLVSGMLFGGLIGAGLVWFLSPNSGEENRRMALKKALYLRDRAQEVTEDITETVLDIFGEVTASTIELYEDARDMMARQVETWQDSMEAIDRKKYLDSVDRVIATLGKDKKNSPQNLEQLKKYWVKNWRKFAAQFE